MGVADGIVTATAAGTVIGASIVIVADGVVIAGNN
jgi:hypothetical protein